MSFTRRYPHASGSSTCAPVVARQIDVRELEGQSTSGDFAFYRRTKSVAYLGREIRGRPLRAASINVEISEFSRLNQLNVHGTALCAKNWC